MMKQDNLDEFFMVRVAGLWAQAEAGLRQKDASGMTPREQITAISEAVHKLSQKQNCCGPARANRST